MNIERWINKIDQATLGFKHSFSGLSAEQLNYKPNETTWSIAQNIDHLIVINETYFPVFDALKDGSYKSPWIGKIGFMVNLLGKTILDSVQPDRKRKIKTLRIWEPSKSNLSAGILNQFEKHQDELKQKILDCSGLFGKGIIIASPANNNIVYKLDTAIDIITTHEQRHLEQAKEVLSGIQ